MLKKQISMLLVFILSVAMVGCSGPPSDVIQNAVKAHLDKTYESNLGEILELDITNEYEQEANDETVYVFEYKALVKHHPDILRFFTNKKEATYTGTVRLVERGNSWYRLH